MKKLLLAISLVALAACREGGPAVDFTPKATDTSFTAPVETPQQRIVVMEEFTGVSCPQCPKGHVLVKTFEDANPGRIAAMSIERFNVGQCEPVDDPKLTPVKTKHDNRTQDGTDISNNVYSAIANMPSAGIDRISQGGSMEILFTDWAGLVPTRLAQPTLANVTITSSYNASSHQASIKVHIAYTSAVAKGQKLTLALVENNVVDAQEGDGPTGFNQNYVHQHVLRDVITAATGNIILTDKPTKQAGLVYERTFVYNVNADWNPDNCDLIAFVSNDNGADQEIVQGALTHLK